jgi:hypothetical protein
VGVGLLTIIIVGTLAVVMSGASSAWAAAEVSRDDAVAESPSEPEERARLAEKRKRLSAEAKAFGTDPSAIVGYYELDYGHSTFTNNLRLDTATAIVALPLTPNWLFRVSMPYAWADLNQPGGFTTNGAGDMSIRTGGRIYASDTLALFVGADASFPTASEMQLGTGKYTIGPGVVLAAPLARVRSLLYVLAQDFISIGGDPSRPDLHYTQVQSAFNTIWTERWWSSVIATWDLDWNNRRKTTMNLQGEIGHQFDDHWNVFAGPGVGVMGRNTFLGLDWTVQAGVRWVFMTPLFSERIFERYPRK